MKDKTLFDNSLIIRAIYSKAACLYKKVPKLISFPKNEEELYKVLMEAKKRGLPITMRGAGSGLAGQSVGEGIIVDVSRYMDHFNFSDGTIETFMGANPSQINKFLKDKGIFFPPEPSSTDFCTIGGMIGNNSKGARSVKYGTTLENLNYIDILLADGSKERIENRPLSLEEIKNHKLKKVAKILLQNREKILKNWPKAKANTSGYNLKDCIKEKNKVNLLPLFVGSEGTLAIFIKASLKLAKLPNERSLAIVEFDTLEDATYGTIELLKFKPSACEILDRTFIDFVNKGYGSLGLEISKDSQALLIVEMDEEDSYYKIEEALKSIKSYSKLKIAENEEEVNLIWKFRKSASPLLNRGRGKLKSVRIVEDGSVPIEAISKYIRGMKEIFKEENIEMVIFGHSGDGNFHINPLMDLSSYEHYEKSYKIVENTAKLLKSLNGSLSGEHGDGRLRAPFLKFMFEDLFDLFVKIKETLDPDNILNRDVKIIKENRDFRESFKISPQKEKNPLKGELSEEKWLREIERCHGCGNCRNFCPSYMATKDEAFSSRGRAFLLQNVIDGTLSEAEILKNISIFDQCLSCRECLKNCPTKVDLAPISSLVLKNYSNPLTKIKNLIYSNFSTIPYKFSLPEGIKKELLNLRILRTLLEILIGLRKEIVFNFSIEKPHFDKNKSYLFEGLKEKEVLLFYGCSYNTLDKDSELKKLLEILNFFHITTYIPPQECCGVSKISKGFYNNVKENILSNKKSFIPYLKNNRCIIFTSPSCGAAIKYDYPIFFEEIETSKISENLVYVSEYLTKKIPIESYLKPLNKKIIYHSSCHGELLNCDKYDTEILSKIPELKILKRVENCCGMAGTFGLVKNNRLISDSLKERLKEELKGIEADFLITNCFSCKIQIQNLTKIKVIHPIELIYQSIFMK